MDLFFLKKAILLFLNPVVLVFILMLSGWMMVVWAGRFYGRLPKEGQVQEEGGASRKKSRMARVGMLLILLGMGLLYLCSISLLVNKMYFSLEKQYPPPSFATKELKSFHPDYIVVLSGAYVYVPGRAITSRLAGASTARLVEGIRLHKKFPKAKLVISGGVAEDGWPSVAEEMKSMARILGYEGEVIVEIEARDTRENASLLKPVLEGKSFILVTSGYHMPRAMALFHGQGLQPVAAAADIKRWPRNNFKFDQLLPSAKNLSSMSLVTHEYLGLMWARLRGQLRAPSQSD